MKTPEDEAADRAVEAHEQATQLCDAGDHRRAVAAARRAVELFERASGADHPDVASALLVLGRAQELADDWKTAHAGYERAAKILAKYARLAHPEIRRLRVKTARALCCVLRALGRYDEAAREGRRAVELGEKWFGADDLDFAGALNDLGMVRKYQGRYAEAPPLYRRALAILRRAGLHQTADAASIYHNLGGIEHARGRYAMAEPPARRAVELRRRALGARNPAVAADVAALAAIVEQRGRLTEAETLYREALEVFTESFGPRCYEVGVNLAGLAGVLHARGQLDEPERLYKEALRIHERLFGEAHIEVAFTLNNLAQVTYDRALRSDNPAFGTKTAADARRLAERALAAFRAGAGPRHQATLACAENLRRMKDVPARRS